MPRRKGVLKVVVMHRRARWRGLWHDLAQGRWPSVIYWQPDGRRVAGGSWPVWCYLPNGLIEHWMQHRGDLNISELPVRQ